MNLNEGEKKTREILCVSNEKDAYRENNPNLVFSNRIDISLEIDKNELDIQIDDIIHFSSLLLPSFLIYSFLLLFLYYEIGFLP